MGAFASAAPTFPKQMALRIFFIRRSSVSFQVGFVRAHPRVRPVQRGRHVSLPLQRRSAHPCANATARPPNVFPSSVMLYNGLARAAWPRLAVPVADAARNR